MTATPSPGDPVRTLVRRRLITVAVDDTLRDAAERLSSELVGVAMVRDTASPALLSERDVVAGIAIGGSPDSALVDHVMTDYVVTVSADESIREAAARMLMNEIRHLPVVDDGEVIGIVSERDLLAVLVHGTGGERHGALEKIGASVREHLAAAGRALDELEAGIAGAAAHVG
jgi:CBS domain-containing protein